MRTSTFTDLRAPTGSLSPSCSARRSFACACSGSSPTSSRNNVPPSASTNLPACFSVAPVKAPFSCPNRIDSTRFSGSAPQLTATKGFALRAPEPWIARAINSLPVPDSPCTITGMDEAAAFSVAQLGGKTARRQRIGERNLQPLGSGGLHDEVAGARAHRRDDVVDAAVRGLHDDREVGAGLAQARQHAQTVEVGHHQIEHHAVDTGGIPAEQTAERRVATIRRERPVTKALYHRFQEPPLDGIVIDDEDGVSHAHALHATCADLAHSRLSGLMVCKCCCRPARGGRRPGEPPKLCRFRSQPSSSAPRSDPPAALRHEPPCLKPRASAPRRPKLRPSSAICRNGI